MRSKIIYSILLVIACSIFILQKAQRPLPQWVNNYWNDLLCIPLVLGALTYSIRWLKKDDKFEFSLGFVIVLSSYYAIYFEYYLPKNNSRYTSDWIDVLLYFSGGLLFYLFQKTSNKLNTLKLL
ncbi:hypothetical protein [Flavobacterium kayseriense]|uniref:hypothetical protein n=1 Tax=Flavobacterium kayseriense TaxID=2764714 RepID=UPI00293B8DBA|nr:hypothetical protein [Flavobacterium kayseriense]